MRKIITIAVISIAAFTAASCAPTDDNARESEESISSEALTQYLESQPIPVFNSSQLRQNLIDIQTAQANATVTTSLFFNEAVVDPIHVCPSIGFPIPGTFQLTNPEQKIPGAHGGNISLPQLEATGVYTGDTAATTVICIDPEGRGYAFYWEGAVSTIVGPATWNSVAKSVDLTGAPTAEFSTGE